MGPGCYNKNRTPPVWPLQVFLSLGSHSLGPQPCPVDASNAGSQVSTAVPSRSGSFMWPFLQTWRSRGNSWKPRLPGAVLQVGSHAQLRESTAGRALNCTSCPAPICLATAGSRAADLRAAGGRGGREREAERWGRLGSASDRAGI